MPGFWQPTLWYRSPRTKSTTLFTHAGKRSVPIRHVKRHRTGLLGTSNKFTLFGNLWQTKKGIAKRRGLL